jgi:hypothetical protein
MCEGRTRKESRDETRKVVGSLSDLNLTPGLLALRDLVN